ncbi:MAG: hypothetical protein ABIW30_07650, partial [Arenimonas sp.]
DPEGGLAFIAQTQPPLELVRAWILQRTGRPAEALAIYRKVEPGLFVQPKPQVYPGQAGNAILAGIALLKTGAKPQGQALLEAVIAALANRPYAAVIAGRGWLEFYAYAQLGQKDRAFTALQDGVNDGYFLSLPELDSDPLLAEFRKDPRYQQILAPARAKAAAQVAAARAAGLL